LYIPDDIISKHRVISRADKNGQQVLKQFVREQMNSVAMATTLVAR